MSEISHREELWARAMTRATIVDVVMEDMKNFDESTDYVESGRDVESVIIRSGITPKKMVEAYRDTGKYYDIDYPGGIEQFVKDYEEGKFDE